MLGHDAPLLLQSLLSPEWGSLLLRFVLFLAVLDFSDLGNVETVHIIDVGVDSPGQAYLDIESVLLISNNSLSGNRKSGIDDFYVSDSGNVVNDCLILFNGDRAGGVYDGTAGLAAINSCSEKLSLEVTSFPNINQSLKY